MAELPYKKKCVAEWLFCKADLELARFWEFLAPLALNEGEAQGIGRFTVRFANTALVC